VPGSRRSGFMVKLARVAALPLLPVLVVQGLVTRQRTVRMCDAAGPTVGQVGSGTGPFRLLLFGESTVAGMGADTHAEALAGHTARALAGHLGRAVVWEALGLSGVTARRARLELLPRLEPGTRDGLVVALGVNDTLAFRSARAWRNDMSALVADLLLQTGAPALVISAVPPLNRFPALPRPLASVLGLHSDALDQELDQVVRRFGGARHVQLPALDVRETFAIDGFHPSPIGYKAWGQQLAVALAAVSQASEPADLTL
jgi:lysophospholipase L1-like esterase